MINIKHWILKDESSIINGESELMIHNITIINSDSEIQPAQRLGINNVYLVFILL